MKRWLGLFALAVLGLAIFALTADRIIRRIERYDRAWREAVHENRGEIQKGGELPREEGR